MLHRFLNSDGSRLIQISLVDGIANDKHVVNTDSNKQEGHQAMNTSSFSSQVEAESKSGGICESNTQETHEGHNESAVHATACAKNNDRVECHKHYSNLDKL